MPGEGGASAVAGRTGPAMRHAGSRLASLDGLRGVAVLAVMVFHLGATWLTGGFFGVDVFYVLSGFLITGLLLDEWARSGGIRLGAFWARRARRLLPALGLVLVAVTAYVHFVATPGSYPGYRSDALATLFYYSNWHQIATSANYFVATGLLSPLTHCWSLAIEEQFYLLWPLVVLAVLAAAGGPARRARAPRLLGWVCVVGSLASALWMARLYADGATTTRLYFGTDTHAQCILVGSALACWMRVVLARPARHRPAGGRPAVSGGEALGLGGGRPVDGWSARLVDAAALVGLAGLGLAANRLSGDSSVTYLGGFLVVSLAAAAVILAVVTVPGGLTARGLALPPLPWLGRISYGLYLWHFPLFLYLSPARTGLSGLALSALRIGATVAVSALSFYTVERPVLERNFWRSARALLPAGAGAVLVSGAIVVATVGPSATAVPAVRFRARLPGATTSGIVRVPPRVVVLGDSTALTLAVALRATAPTGTRVTEEALYSCGLPIGSDLSADAPRPGLTLPSACNESSSPAQQWPALDQQAVAGTTSGDVVLYLGGHNDIQDVLQHGTWSNILSARFRRAERSALALVESIAIAHGAHLDLLTMPCVDNSAQTGVPPEPAGAPRRQALFNGMLDTLAAAHPGPVSLIDYRSMLCPHGRFTDQVDGVEVRSPDGVHTPAYAPDNPYAGNSPATVASRFYSWLAARLWPRIIASAGTAPSAGGRHSQPQTPSAPTPATGVGERSDSGSS